MQETLVLFFKSSRSLSRMPIAALLACVAALGACGGGADGSAGDGAPLKKVVVTLTDSKGNMVSGLTDNNGRFLLKYKTSVFTAPLVLRAIGVGGSVLSSVTDEIAASGKTIRANINPLTDKITSDVLPASVAGTDKVFDGSKVDITKLAKAKADLVASVKAALGTAGIADTSRFDPIKSAYNYDGTGVDAVIESISHVRDPATGATQLRAKLVSVQNNPDGTFVPTLITASTPLATTQVALASNPVLTYDKINNWMNFFNSCLAAPAPGSLDCQDADGSRLISRAYKSNSRTLEADLNTLLSESDKSHVPGSSLRNPSILLFARSTGSTIDDLVAVEFTINQPRTGPLAGNSTTPIEYTRVLVFKRDDTLTRAKAGNWILFGNQRNFDWGVEPRYLSTVQTNQARQANTAGNNPSNMRAGLRMRFNSQVYNSATNSFAPSNVYAVRVKGPGLPSAGIVLAPRTTSTVSDLTILNKTGVIPAQGTLATAVQTDFRMSGALLGTGAPLDPAVWDTSRVYLSDNLNGTDFSTLQAYSRYQAEIYVNGSTAPTVETSVILAPIQAPALMAKIPLHDLSANTPLITPPQAATSTATVQWSRVPGAVRIESAFAYFFSNSSFALSSAGVGDAFSLAPRSTSVTISNGAIGFPASALTDYREVGIVGSSNRASFIHILARNP